VEVRIHPEVRIGHIHLIVADLERSLKFTEIFWVSKLHQIFGDKAVFYPLAATTTT